MLEMIGQQDIQGYWTLSKEVALLLGVQVEMIKSAKINKVRQFCNINSTHTDKHTHTHICLVKIPRKCQNHEVHSLPKNIKAKSDWEQIMTKQIQYKLHLLNSFSPTDQQILVQTV